MVFGIAFHRIGPYHHARLKAASKRCGILALEMTSVDKTYAWAKLDDASEYRKITVFSDIAIEDQSVDEISRRIANALCKVRPDVMLIPGWSEKWALILLAWCLQEGIPAVIMSDSTQFDFPRHYWKELIKIRILRMFSAALVAGGPHMDYLQKLGFPYYLCLPGYDVVDNEYFKLGSAQARLQEKEVRLRYGLPARYFLTSSRFVEKKNILRIVDSFLQYRQMHGEHAWDLVMLGDGVLRPVLENKIREHGLSEHVYLLGFKQYHELPIYYGLANAFVHASTSEQWGLVVNEAMASGLPVILSDACGCAQDLVEEGRNGFTFNPHDVNKLASLMLHVSGEDCDCESMGRSSQEIISRWSPELFAKNLKALAEMVLVSPRPSLRILDKLLLKALLYR